MVRLLYGPIERELTADRERLDRLLDPSVASSSAAVLAGSRLVDVPAGRHVGAEALLGCEVGTMSAVERGRIERHADSCFPCAHAPMVLATASAPARRPASRVRA